MFFVSLLHPYEPGPAVRGLDRILFVLLVLLLVLGFVVLVICFKIVFCISICFKHLTRRSAEAYSRSEIGV